MATARVRRTRQQHRGFTLVDLMVAMAVLAILAVMVIPSSNPGESMKLISAATVIATDIEFAQSITLAEPSDHTVLVFHPDGGGYFLSLASAPLVPIARPGTGDDYVVRYGEGHVRTLSGVLIQEGALLEPIEFDAFGSLSGLVDRSVTLVTMDGIIDVTIRQSTGSVAIVKP